jgi:hypothetical protein
LPRYHAAAAAQESLQLRRAADDRLGAAFVQVTLAAIAIAWGDCTRACDLYRHALATFRDVADRAGAAAGLEGLASVAHQQERANVAARLYGAATALRREMGSVLEVAEQAVHDERVGAVRTALGEEAFVAAWADGAALRMDDALALALGA